MKLSRFSFRGSLLVVCALPILLAACGFVREVRRTPNGGELAIRGRSESTEKEAADMMRARCPAGYDILEEGEVVTGQQTVTQAQGQGMVTQSKTTHLTQTQVLTTQQGTSTTQNTTEWRIAYQCKGAAPAPTQQPVPEAPPAPAQPRPESRIHTIIVRR